MTSHAFSLIMYTAITMKKPGMPGKIIAAEPLRYYLSCHLFYVPRFSATMASKVLTLEMTAAVVAAR
jgi:hypothetical protein